ncbi:Ubiquitin receptor RAD23d isoform B [Glycine soja]|uniref:Ubiquitin receptor RAD23 n=1 Tax=Glycine soja TaxID=3848 RepID=A0A445FZR9_GLYSO|nr:Ubiquitin receptor RAD23d isoform B [Glycine soja]
MKINVKTLKGTHFVLQVNPQDTVAVVKKNIETAQGADVYPAAQQMLIHQGKVLNDATTLEENKVVENNFVVIMLSKNKVSSGASSAPSNLGTQPQSSLPPTSSTSQPPASAVGQGESNSEQSPVITPPTIAVPSIYDHAASNLMAGSNLETTIQQILEMGGGNWDRDTVTGALHAAFNNPERAIEYLYSGIPERADVPAAVRSLITGQAENSSIQSTQPAVPTGGPNTNPLNLFPQGLPNMSAIDNRGDLDSLRNREEFQALRETMRENPQILQPMIQELGQQNPQLMQIIQDHQEDILDLMNEPEGDENLQSQLDSMISGTVTITPEENEAIQRVSH